MTLQILSPAGTIVDEEVDKVVLPGEKCRFVVLNKHAPLISLLTKGIVQYVAGEEEKEIEIERGISIVENNTIQVVLTE